MKENLNEDISYKLFNQLDIDYVGEQVDINLPLLYGQDCSIQNDDELSKIKETVNTMYNSEIRKLFKKYEGLLMKDIQQQNCLAYYVGLKNGLELKKLK